MVFSYNWLQSFFKERLPKPEKLAELLTFHSFEVEEVRKKGNDWVFDIAVLPNRAPDCFSHLGVAREIAAIMELNFSTGVEKVNKPIEDKKLRTKDFVSVEVKDKDACLRYTARIVVGVKVAPSPEWLQERLKVCGLRPINNIVDIANYVMLETGQPLHAFDLDKLYPTNYESKRITNKKIIVRFAKKGEKIITLDNEEYNFGENILIIADAKEPLAIAGIKGGKKAEIDKKTKIIVLESANFDQKTIRLGSKKLGLKTDASLRFEHGLDPNLTTAAINQVAFLIQKIAGGKITQGLVDVYPKKVLPKKIKLDLNYLNDLLGVAVSKKESIEILKRLDFDVMAKGKNLIEVTVPTRRLDVLLPEDLIEEIGRIFGYEKIPATFPISSLIPAKRNDNIFWEDIVKDALKEFSFTEAYNYSFLGEKEAEIFGYKTQKGFDLLELENPISNEQKYLRPSLLPNLLKNVEKNQRSFSEIKIFELGNTFKKIKNQITEKNMLSALITGDAFYQAKGIVDMLLNKLGISNVWYDSYQPTPEESDLELWQLRKCAEIKIDSEEIGFLGEISPKILEELKITKKVTCLDLDFEKLVELASEEQEYRPISRYPSAVRDLAILVPREVLVEEVLNKIENTGGKLVRDVDLFDIYEGEELPEGKKNLAFHIIYQAEDHTLSSKEINKIHNGIIQVLEGNPEWEVRK